MSFARLVVVSILLGAVGMINALPTIPDGTNNNDALPFNYTCTQPNLTKSGPWSNLSFIEKNLIPNPEAPASVFWGGRLGDNGTLLQQQAEKCAKNVTGATLGQLMCNYNLNHNNAPPTDQFVMPENFQDPLWTKTSQIFANLTGSNTGSNISYVVLGDTIVTATWLTVEWPTVRSNTNVTAVIGLHPGTCAKSCYWHCPNKTACPDLVNNTLKFCTVNPDGN